MDAKSKNVSRVLEKLQEKKKISYWDRVKAADSLYPRKAQIQGKENDEFRKDRMRVNRQSLNQLHHPNPLEVKGFEVEELDGILKERPVAPAATLWVDSWETSNILAVAARKRRIVYLDAEHYNRDSYTSFIALVQLTFNDDNRVFLIDTVQKRSVEATALRSIVEHPERILVTFGGANDLILLRRDLGISPLSYLDLQKVDLVSNARLQPSSLDTVLNQQLGVTIAGAVPKSVLQVADFKTRPLHQDLIAYASDDVKFLPQLLYNFLQKDSEAVKSCLRKGEEELLNVVAPLKASDLDQICKGLAIPNEDSRRAAAVILELRRQRSIIHDASEKLVMSEEMIRLLAESQAKSEDEIGSLLKSRRHLGPAKLERPLLNAIVKGPEVGAEAIKLVCNSCGEQDHPAYWCYLPKSLRREDRPVGLQERQVAATTAMRLKKIKEAQAKGLRPISNCDTGYSTTLNYKLVVEDRDMSKTELRAFINSYYQIKPYHQIGALKSMVGRSVVFRGTASFCCNKHGGEAIEKGIKTDDVVCSFWK